MENGALGFVHFIPLALGIFVIVAMWKTFSKAGQPGWASIIPIYNIYILIQIAGRPGWWVLLFFIPLANLIVNIIVNIDIARNFGKGAGFGVGLYFLPFIFFPIIAFSDAQFTG